MRLYYWEQARRKDAGPQPNPPEKKEAGKNRSGRSLNQFGAGGVGTPPVFKTGLFTLMLSYPPGRGTTGRVFNPPPHHQQKSPPRSNAAGFALKSVNRGIGGLNFRGKAAKSL